MKKTIIAAAMLVGATSAQAATVNGFNDVQDLGNGIYKFVFDTLPKNPGDIDGTGMGLKFTNGVGLDLIATSEQGRVRQDYPGNGGLGVLGTTGTDNLETALGETLKLGFSSSVSIVNWTFNGLMNKDGHQDAADGKFKADVVLGSLDDSASVFDGVGSDVVPDLENSVCDFNSAFCNVSSILFSGSSFKGYLESITVQVPAVPLPASAGFLIAGLAGFGVAKRKRRKT